MGLMGRGRGRGSDVCTSGWGSGWRCLLFSLFVTMIPLRYDFFGMIKANLQQAERRKIVFFFWLILFDISFGKSFGRDGDVLFDTL